MGMDGLLGRCFHYYNIREIYDGQTIPNSGHVSRKSKPQDTGKAQGSQSNGACVNTWSDANIVFDCIP